jgi:DNA-binding CsgD family transcriptional regulator
MTARTVLSSGKYSSTRPKEITVVDTEYPSADPKTLRAWMAAAFLLGAIACDTLDGTEALGLAMEHALDLPGADKGPPFSLPIQPAPDSKPTRLCVRLTEGETRVLRYLPSHLSAHEIADELYVSSNTVKTHQRHLYQKLGVHTRSQAIARARALGLLSLPPAGRERQVILADENASADVVVPGIGALDRPVPPGLDRGLVALVRDFPAHVAGSELLTGLLRAVGAAVGSPSDAAFDLVFRSLS